MLTIWVPLVDATLENGCLEVMPRSHTDGLRRHTQNSYGLGIIPEDLPSIEPQPLPLQRGGVILFHNYTLHHARPNETDAVRWSFDLPLQRRISTDRTPLPPGVPYAQQAAPRGGADRLRDLPPEVGVCTAGIT